jgi:methylated-DNA-[protein]-cysteine S-methyltransferase
MDEIEIIYYETHFGYGALRWRGELLAGHELPREREVKGAKSMPKEYGGITAVRAGLLESLEAYFAGEVSGYDFRSLPVDMALLSEFEQRVAAALTATSCGELISYAGLAQAAGYPGAARAVGNFMAKNPWPIIIPCHRVIRSDGRLGGFAYGETWKRRLIELEASGLRVSDMAKTVVS